MATLADESTRAHQHKGDEELQHEAREGGSSINPANPRPGGEEVFPKLISAFDLRHSHYRGEIKTSTKRIQVMQ